MLCQRQLLRRDLARARMRRRRHRVVARAHACKGQPREVHGLPLACVLVGEYPCATERKQPFLACNDVCQRIVLALPERGDGACRAVVRLLDGGCREGDAERPLGDRARA